LKAATLTVRGAANVIEALRIHTATAARSVFLFFIFPSLPDMAAFRFGFGVFGTGRWPWRVA
jgi:hypothetical protein